MKQGFKGTVLLAALVIAIMALLAVVTASPLPAEAAPPVSGGDALVMAAAPDAPIQANTAANRAALVLTAVFALFTAATVWQTAAALAELVRGRRAWNGSVPRTLGSAVFPILLLLAFAYGVYRLPPSLLDESWQAIRAGGPASLLYAVYAIVAAAAAFALYSILIQVFPKGHERPWFQLIAASVFSGIGNATVIFTINAAITASGLNPDRLIYYYGFGILLYVSCQRLVRHRLIAMANDLVYSTRMQMIAKLLGASYDKLERIEKGKIQAGLNNDTEMLSNFANTLISVVTSMVTLLFCFLYLGLLNPVALLASLAVIAAAIAMYMAASVANNRLWEKARDIQNVFFAYLSDMIGGTKELKLSGARRTEFQADIEESLHAYKTYRLKGEKKFANVIIIGELLFVLVVGGVAFLFPHLFADIDLTVLQNFVLVFLYMMGPIMSLLNTVPHLLMVRIAWHRIRAFSGELDEMRDGAEHAAVLPPVDRQGSVRLELENVGYEYSNGSGETFSLGPIDYEFRGGEIVFITGGNGSGKSTLAKLITGLYKPHKGAIAVNGTPVRPGQLGELYSAVFADFYLFEKLYGIGREYPAPLVDRYMDKLHMRDKVRIENGRFSTTSLSTGQRKRLALLTSYMEDKPICLFDEWAADQDPEFRRFFYEELLPELKSLGKCVIAITHDDQYFHLCDRLIKMESGRIHPSDPHPARTRAEEMVLAVT